MFWLIDDFRKCLHGLWQASHDLYPVSHISVMVVSSLFCISRCLRWHTYIGANLLIFHPSNFLTGSSPIVRKRHMREYHSSFESPMLSICGRSTLG
jgi:hypothetical protein